MFLDLKPQRFDIDGKPHIFQFAEDFRTVLINGHPFTSQFGGDPKEIYVNGRQHYFRLTALPRGVRVGQTLKSREEVFSQNQQPQKEAVEAMDEESQEAMNLDRSFINNQTESPTAEKPALNYFKNEADKNAEKPEKIEKPVQKPLDFEKIQNLFSGLVQSGLIKDSKSIPGLDLDPKPSDKVPEKSEPEPEKPVIKPVPKMNWSKSSKIKEVVPINLRNQESIKSRQEAIIDRLFDSRSMQCKTCGLRFPPNDMTYSKHLDWHFRMQKRKQQALQKSKSRKWFLELDIWFISNEIEEETIEENESKIDEIEEIPTVAKSENPELNRCPVCREDFEVIFVQDQDTLHLHNAIRPDGPDSPAYHPLCYNDRANIDADHSLIDESIEESMDVSVESEVPVENSDVENSGQNLEKSNIENSEIPKSSDVENTEVSENSGEVPAAEIKVEPMETENSEDKVETTEAEKSSENLNEDEIKTEVKEEPQEEETKETEPSLDDSGNLGNLTADAGVTTAPNFNIAANIKFNITSQVSHILLQFRSVI